MRLALHVLHHQVGLAVVGGAAVEERGDVGMLEARQDLPLLPEAPLEVLGVAPARTSFSATVLRNASSSRTAR